jgi:hypothetical protein
MKNLYLLVFISFLGQASAQSLSNKLDDYTWVANSGSITAYINFESIYDGASSGGMVIWTNFNSCMSSYTYNVSANTILAKFLKNSCGSTSSNQSFTYDSSTNSISMYMNGNKQTYYAKSKRKP